MVSLISDLTVKIRWIASVVLRWVFKLILMAEECCFLHTPQSSVFSLVWPHTPPHLDTTWSLNVSVGNTIQQVAFSLPCKVSMRFLSFLKEFATGSDISPICLLVQLQSLSAEVLVLWRPPLSSVEIAKDICGICFCLKLLHFFKSSTGVFLSLHLLLFPSLL